MTTTTFDSGLRVIANRTNSAAIYMGYAINAGTRHELDSEPGMAHFTEHVTFKGTERRSALQIINSIEGVGGELNAFTGKEETVYYCTVEPRHFRRALDVLTDIVFHSTYPEEEMRREAEVVCDEIEMYNDTPSELIFDDFEALVFGSHPLGRNILGNADRLRQFTSADMQAYARRLYRAERSVLFVSGPVDEERIIRQATDAAGDIARATGEGCRAAEGAGSQAAREAPFERTIQRNVHQAHVMLGTRAIPANHPDRMTLVLLNNIVGGPGLNSRLNLSLRERHGLVYNVESNYTGYTDTGVWSVYFGCDAADVKRCRRLIARELDSLMQHPLPARTLAAAKRQLCGQLTLSYDQHESIATGMGKTFLHSGIYRTAGEIADRIQSVSSDQLLGMAQTLFPTLSSLMYV